jgi:hypothetical protein
MKKFILTGLFLFAGLFLLSAQNMPSINIVNNTGYDIYFLYVSPSESDEWGDDILGDAILEDGKTFNYRLSQSLGNVSTYDFLAEDEDDEPYIKWEITITNNGKIVFTPDDLFLDY